VLVGEGDLDLLAAFDDVGVGEDVTLLVEEEAGTLTLLRDGTVEEVVGDGGRGDVDDGGKGLLVDGDVLLLFGVVGGRGGGLRELEGSVGAVERGDVERFGRVKEVVEEGARGAGGADTRGEVVEAGEEDEDQEDRAQFGWLQGF